jgi:hypothetical protein
MGKPETRLKVGHVAAAVLSQSGIFDESVSGTIPCDPDNPGGRIKGRGEPSAGPFRRTMASCRSCGSSHHVADGTFVFDSDLFVCHGPHAASALLLVVRTPTAASRWERARPAPGGPPGFCQDMLPDHFRARSPRGNSAGGQGPCQIMLPDPFPLCPDPFPLCPRPVGNAGTSACVSVVNASAAYSLESSTSTSSAPPLPKSIS